MPGPTDAPPVVFIHGLWLLGQDLAVSAVAIDAAQIKGVLPLPLSALLHKQGL